MSKNIQDTSKNKGTAKPKDFLGEIFNDGRKVIGAINKEVSHLEAIMESLRRKGFRGSPARELIYEITSDRVNRLIKIRKGLATQLGEFIDSSLRDNLF